MRLRATALRDMRDGRREAQPGQPQTRSPMRIRHNLPTTRQVLPEARQTLPGEQRDEQELT
jgi:hypothetical protein